MAEESTESTVSVDEGTSPETEVQVQTEAVLENPTVQTKSKDSSVKPWSKRYED